MVVVQLWLSSRPAAAAATHAGADGVRAILVATTSSLRVCCAHPSRHQAPIQEKQKEEKSG